MLFVFLFVCRSLCMFLCQSPCLVWRSLFGNVERVPTDARYSELCQKSAEGLMILQMNLPPSLSEKSSVCFCSLYLHTSTLPANHCIEWAWKGVSDAVRQSVKHLVWRMLRPWVVQLLTSTMDFKISCGDFKASMSPIFCPAFDLIFCKISEHLQDRLLWNLLWMVMVPWGWLPRTLTTPWPLLFRSS